MIKYLFEIKNRTLLLLITWLSILLVSYFYKETLLFIVLRPHQILSINYFIFTNVTEILLVHFELINFLSFQVLFLCFVYHFFAFFSNALFRTEYNFISFFFKITLIVWLCSASLVNFLLVPLSWGFFFSFHDLVNNKFINIHFEAKLSEYVGFFIMVYYICVCYSQIFTILVVFLGSATDTGNTIKKFRKTYFFVFIFFSTLICPPDIFSQISISFLFLFFYECLAFVFILTNYLTR